MASLPGSRSPTSRLHSSKLGHMLAASMCCGSSLTEQAMANQHGKQGVSQLQHFCFTGKADAAILLCSYSQTSV